MSVARPAINVVEKNPYAPRPFVFSEAAVCLRDSIRAAGYPSEHLVNRIDPAAFSIVLGGTPAMERELAHMEPGRCAIFNFEQLGSDSGMAGPEYRRWLADWVVLDYHGGNVALLRRENGARQVAFEVPLVPSANLVSSGPETKDVDVLFYGTMSERREKLLRKIAALRIRAGAVAGSYGSELAPALRRARIVIHVHYYDTRLFPVVRMLQPLAMGLPIACESSVFSTGADWSGSGIVFADYDELPRACARLLASPDRGASAGAMAREFALGRDFATPFAQVVRAFEKRLS